MINQQGRLNLQRKAVMEELDKIDGISYVKNTAAFYLFPKLDLQKFSFSDDRDFARQLLEEKHILIVPGSGFNCMDKSHFRIVMLPKEKELRKAIKDIGDFLSKKVTGKFQL